MPEKPSAKILLVDDEPDVLETTKWAFETLGYQVYTATTGEDAVKVMASTRPELLLIDYKLPQMSGVDFLKTARAMDPTVTAIMITGLTHQTEEIQKECEQLGTFAFLHKPLSMEQVLETVKEALDKKLRNPASPSTTA